MAAAPASYALPFADFDRVLVRHGYAAAGDAQTQGRPYAHALRRLQPEHSARFERFRRAMFARAGWADVDDDDCLLGVMMQYFFCA